MVLKNYLAAFLILIFLGKFVAIDSQLLGIILDTSEVTLVNKMCLKKQLQSDQVAVYVTGNIKTSFELNYLCHSVFDLRKDDWSEILSENNFKKYAYRPPGNSSIPGDKFYPPPKDL